MKVTIHGYAVDFPFEPYASQKSLMSKVWARSDLAGSLFVCVRVRVVEPPFCGLPCRC